MSFAAPTLLSSWQRKTSVNRFKCGPPDGIGDILTEQIKAVARQAEYVGADKTKFPALEKESESGTAHLLVCSTDLEQERPFSVYEYMPSRQGQSLAAHLKN